MVKLIFLFFFLSFSSLLISTSLYDYARASPFQEEHESHPFKVVVVLHYTHNQISHGVSEISLSYEDGDGFKQIKYYNFDKMVHRAQSEPVKLEAKFPRNTVSDYEDYLVCVTDLNNHQKKCSGDSRSPETDEEKIHINFP